MVMEQGGDGRARVTGDPPKAPSAPVRKARHVGWKGREKKGPMKVLELDPATQCGKWTQ